MGQNCNVFCCLLGRLPTHLLTFLRLNSMEARDRWSQRQLSSSANTEGHCRHHFVSVSTSYCMMVNGRTQDHIYCSIFSSSLCLNPEIFHESSRFCQPKGSILLLTSVLSFLLYFMWYLAGDDLRFCLLFAKLMSWSFQSKCCECGAPDHTSGFVRASAFSCWW